MEDGPALFSISEKTDRDFASVVRDRRVRDGSSLEKRIPLVVSQKEAFFGIGRSIAVAAARQHKNARLCQVEPPSALMPGVVWDGKCFHGPVGR